MNGFIDRTLSAICYSLCAERAGDDEDGLPPPYDDVVRFVAGQMQRMPAFLRFGVRAATLLFGLGAMGRGGAPFHRLGLPRRTLHVAAWRTSRLGPCRDLIRFYESLAVVALYSRPDWTRPVLQPARGEGGGRGKEPGERQE
jgi:hypothetical protein